MKSTLSVFETNCVVVDDDYNTTNVFCEILEMYGFNVIGRGYDAETAITLFEQKRPTITFLDVMMEPKDGCYALEKIKEKDPNAIVIMVTVDLRKEIDKKLKDLKASAVIYKPFHPQELLKIVSMLTSTVNGVLIK